MRMFLMRLFGDSKQTRKEEKRFKENLRQIEEREKELDQLGEQLERVQKAAKTKQSTLNDTCIDFTEALSRRMTSSDMAIVTSEEVSVEDVEEGRTSSDPVPSGAVG